MPSPYSVPVSSLASNVLMGYNSVLIRFWHFVVSFCILIGHHADVFYSLLQSKGITKFLVVVVDKIVFKIATFCQIVQTGCVGQITEIHVDPGRIHVILKSRICYYSALSFVKVPSFYLKIEK
jgi:hypothetical protein